MQVVLIALPKLGHFGRRNGVVNAVLNVDEGTVQKGLNAVTLGEVEEKFPANGLAGLEADAVDFCLAGNFGTGS
ncbi:MAG TPA: hypothetical protein VK812_13030 [Candidatus Binatus sp.]|nr:hypothetical protein [Candidatus Binatus sp.]